MGRAVTDAGLTPLYSLFRPPFQEEGHASALLAGDWSFAGTLALGRHADHLLVGRAEITSEASPQAADLRVARLVLEIRCWQTQTQSGCGYDRLTAEGAAFTETAAQDVAIRHLTPALRGFIGQAGLARAAEQEERP